MKTKKLKKLLKKWESMNTQQKNETILLFNDSLRGLAPNEIGDNKPKQLKLNKKQTKILEKWLAKLALNYNDKYSGSAMWALGKSNNKFLILTTATEIANIQESSDHQLRQAIYALGTWI